MVIDPTAGDLALTAILFAIVLGLSWREGLKIERTFLHAALRTVVQLFLVGYLIESIFELSRWYLVAAMLVAMSGIAAYEGAKRLPPRTVPYAAGLVWIAVFVGTFVDTFIVTEVILKIEPWWNPRYLIPLAGMIMGNALNSGSQAGERFIADFKNRLAEVETMLSLGYSSEDSSAEIRRNAVRSALIPTLNSMFTVGLVHLPGMMTGQILGGASPLIATKYQIVVMFMISSTVVITALVMLHLLRRRIFTAAHQIRYGLFQEIASGQGDNKLG